MTPRRICKLQKNKYGNGKPCCGSPRRGFFCAQQDMGAGSRPAPIGLRVQSAKRMAVRLIFIRSTQKIGKFNEKKFLQFMEGSCILKSVME